MNAAAKLDRKYVVQRHVESKKGSTFRVVRLELSKSGQALLTSKSEEISNGVNAPVRKSSVESGREELAIQ